MSIEYATGSIFDCGAQALVNPVNCVGTMGSGLAREFKRRFPHNFEEYAAACRLDNMRIGYVLPFFEDKYWIMNLPTKSHWREKSRKTYILGGLWHLTDMIREHHIQSVAIPALGCGLGGLDWADVKPLIERVAGTMPNVRVLIFAPQ